MSTKRQGFGIIEIIVTIGMISLIVVSIGLLLDSVARLNQTSKAQSKAAVLAQEPMELLVGMKDDLFSCSTGTSTPTCTRMSDGQSCNITPSFTSCWTRYPKDLTGTEFYFENSGSGWSLKALGSGEWETIPTDPGFKRKIRIENALRDASGSISASGTPDYDTKIITVLVDWTEKGMLKEKTLKIILTGWKNI